MKVQGHDVTFVRDETPAKNLIGSRPYIIDRRKEPWTEVYLIERRSDSRLFALYGSTMSLSTASRLVNEMLSDPEIQEKLE